MSYTQSDCTIRNVIGPEAGYIRENELLALLEANFGAHLNFEIRVHPESTAFAFHID